MTKATARTHKAVIQISEIDRGIYGDHALTIARHPSETDKRMIIRLLAFALNVPPNNDVSVYSFASSTNVWWKAIESKLTASRISPSGSATAPAPSKSLPCVFVVTKFKAIYRDGNDQFGQFSDVLPLTVSGS